MKLNPDCVRDVLFAIEEESSAIGLVVFSRDENPEILQKYSWDEFLYHVNQCELSGFITPVRYYDAGDSFAVSDLLPEGHNFLANIRADNNWNKTKEVAKKVGSFSLDALKEIASNVISNVIRSTLNS